MPLREVFSKAGTITTNTTWELDGGLDLSRSDALRMRAWLTGAPGADSTDKVDIYLQARDKDGYWTDRVHLAQLAGNAAAPSLEEANLQKFDSLASGEKTAAPPGPSPLTSRLAAGTTREGPFPGVYRANVIGGFDGQAAGASWRVSFEITTGNAPSFPVQIQIYTDTLDVQMTP